MMSFGSRRMAVALMSAFPMIASTMVTAPASAQLYWRSPDFRGAPVTGAEPGVVIPLPDAKPDEINAEIVWTMRAGLNFAALQCNFAPSLMTRENYNALLGHHNKELIVAESVRPRFKNLFATQVNKVCVKSDPFAPSS